MTPSGSILGSEKARRSASSGASSNHVVNRAVTEADRADSRREVYKFEKANNVVVSSSLGEQYVPGNRFKYVALGGKPSEGIGSRMRRLLHFGADTKTSEIPISKLPKIKLIELQEQFPLSQAVPKNGKEYIMFKSVMGTFVPLMSASSAFTTVKISLLDNRMRTDNTCVQSVSFNSNLCQNFQLSMDYCIHRSSAEYVILHVKLDWPILKQDEQWGVMSVQLKLEEADVPHVSSHQDAVAASTMPRTPLDHNTTILEQMNRLNPELALNTRKSIERIQNGFV